MRDLFEDTMSVNVSVAGSNSRLVGFGKAKVQMRLKDISC